MNGKGFHLCVKDVPFLIINDYNDSNNNNNFLIRGIQKEYVFCQKWYIKGKGLDFGVEPPVLKL